MRKSKKKWIWILLILLLLAAGAGGAVFLIPRDQAGKEEDAENKESISTDVSAYMETEDVEKKESISADVSAYMETEDVEKKEIWLDSDGERFYVGADGEPVKDRMITIEGKKYFFDQEGRLVTGKSFQYEWTIYIADDQGVLTKASGWTEMNGNTYYAKSDGTMVVDETIEVDGKIYHLGIDGHLVKDGFYTSEDKLYYADASGVTRKEEGWFTREGKEYYSDSDGSFFVSQYITVDGRNYFMDKTGVKFNGKPTIDQYLGCDDLYGWMTSHFSDYYFKTPYVGIDLYRDDAEYLIKPYGIYGDEGAMNCTGFICSLITSSGGDLTKISDMGRPGGYGNADNILLLALEGYVVYEDFNSVDELLASGMAKKGNIFYLAPEWGTGDCHMAVFWGETSSDNKIWSQTPQTLCTVTDIHLSKPIKRIFMFPLACNLDSGE